MVLVTVKFLWLAGVLVKVPRKMIKKRPDKGKRLCCSLRFRLTNGAKLLRQCIPGYIESFDVSFLYLKIQATHANTLPLIQFMRLNSYTRCNMLIDIFATDYLSRSGGRFEICYSLLSLSNNTRVIITTSTDESAAVPSCVGAYASAGWYEREIWDLFGILFIGNHDMRRILTDYGFRGHPFRRDFPLSGYEELYYDETCGRTIYTPLSLIQEPRAAYEGAPWSHTYKKYMAPWLTRSGFKPWPERSMDESWTFYEFKHKKENDAKIKRVKERVKRMLGEE